MLTKDNLLALATSRPVHREPVAGGEVGIRVMTGTERETWEQQCFTDGKADLEHFRAKLLVKVLCDDQGNRLFTDDDIPAVSDMPAPVIVQLYTVASRLNALSDDDVDELTKKSPAGRTTNSDTDSPAT